MTRHGGFRDLKRIVLNSTHRCLFGFQLVRPAGHAGAQENKFRHKVLCAAIIATMWGKSNGIVESERARRRRQQQR
jgi:hypothetical protein